METKFQKFSNSLSSIFGTHKVCFTRLDDESFCVRSSETCMFCGKELIKLIELANRLELNFYIRSHSLGYIDCVEFVIY